VTQKCVGWKYEHPQISISDPFLLNLSNGSDIAIVLSVEMHSIMIPQYKLLGNLPW
jgi:hypothetical protein